MLKFIIAKPLNETFVDIFYAWKQLLLSARLSHRNSLCLFVCLSHG